MHADTASTGACESSMGRAHGHHPRRVGQGPPARNDRRGEATYGSNAAAMHDAVAAMPGSRPMVRHRPVECLSTESASRASPAAQDGHQLKRAVAVTVRPVP
ncbi:hypothetical protein OK348_12855 [Flavobacterium sp. MXW15]|uniref:Uncharacterized protein n=1 Tax=Xanthomonas chitinilytica TaxID=2989819 RepID=A0ABT3JWG9_9XANT|nr:hypothetical protein [Xanthomonas sp. H13-6]MCW4455675.1 hypothetical protein [Flavobacterium sp. MXW15]MCW4472839.1 hypothetical protein [Xanthomonas sp. H13-6]